MLYLEDYLEMIEHLPQELRDRFTEMRELDLTVQNSIDSLEKKTRVFFMQCKRGELQNEAAEAEFQNLRKQYDKVKEDADEKVAIATQLHELVERYLRRLDSELFKFKCELEADNNGITEILEKRSLEADTNSSAATALMNIISANQKENRYYGAMGGTVTTTIPTNSHSTLLGPSSGGGGGGHSIGMGMSTGSNKEIRYRTPKPEKRRDSTTNVDKRQNITSNLNPPITLVRPITPSIGLLGSVGVPGNTNPTLGLQQINSNIVGTPTGLVPLAAANPTTLPQTQQIQQNRRATSTVKAPFEAIQTTAEPTEFWINRDISTATAPNAPQPTGSVEKKHKKKLNSSLTHAHTLAANNNNNINNNNNNTVSSTVSLASSSSSVSVDSVDMLPSSSSSTILCGNVVNVGTLGGATSSNAPLGPSTSAAAAAAAAVATAVDMNNRASSTASSSSTTATNLLAPVSNITLGENGMVVEQTTEGEWSYDPNEPRYCTCNQVSYGDMVACDNDACPFEWFHYPCVGITQPPKGKWYCPKCTASMRRRGNRKN